MGEWGNERMGEWGNGGMRKKNVEILVRVVQWWMI